MYAVSAIGTRTSLPVGDDFTNTAGEKNDFPLCTLTIPTKVWPGLESKLVKAIVS